MKRETILLLTCVCAAGCSTAERGRWPFPQVQAADDTSVLTVLRERTRSPGSLYAELWMSFESAEQGGVFDVVVLYDGADRLRMTAFRDLALSTRDIFDLVITGESYELALWGEEEGASGPERHAGSLADLSSVHRGYLAFAFLREGFFLPGPAASLQDVEVERINGSLRVLGSPSPGVTLMWDLKARRSACAGPRYCEMRRNAARARDGNRRSASCMRATSRWTAVSFPRDSSCATPTPGSSSRVASATSS